MLQGTRQFHHLLLKGYDVGLHLRESPGHHLVLSLRLLLGRREDVLKLLQLLPSLFIMVLLLLLHFGRMLLLHLLEDGGDG